jgi:ATP-dependent Clp protease ATP-binding subunit ClpA
MPQLEIYRERFAESGWEIFERAVEETLRRRQKYLGVEHILSALIEVKTEYFLSLLRSLSDNPDAIAMLTELIEERLKIAPKHEGQGVRLATETIALFKRTLLRVRSQKRQRIEATDLFITLVMEEKSLLRELLGKLLADPQAKKKHSRDLFALIESVGATSVPLKQQKFKYLSGETVRIKRGPFASFTGTIEMVDEEVGVLSVRVSIMGREHPIGLSFLDVEKIELDK